VASKIVLILSFFIKVMIMGKNKKQYIGAIEDESEAA
jgi:hypothetical protein